ncbi:MAG: hypothetical protein V4747_20330 [Pseudomonadota bacterium]
MTDCMNFKISRHAALRCAQRGVSAKCLEQLISHADVAVSAGGAATCWSISRKEAAGLNLDDKAASYAAIISDDAVLITIAPVHRGHRGRRWRRGVGRGRA